MWLNCHDFGISFRGALTRRRAVQTFSEDRSPRRWSRQDTASGVIIGRFCSTLRSLFVGPVNQPPARRGSAGRAAGHRPALYFGCTLGPDQSPAAECTELDCGVECRRLLLLACQSHAALCQAVEQNTGLAVWPPPCHLVMGNLDFSLKLQQFH